MNHPTLYERVFVESRGGKPSFLDSVHGLVKAADISDESHPLHRFFSKLGEIGHALKSGHSSGSSRHSLRAVHHSPRHSDHAAYRDVPSARQTLRSLKRDVRDVRRSRERSERQAATLRAMGRAQPGTGPQRSPAQPRRGVPGMQAPIQ